MTTPGFTTHIQTAGLTRPKRLAHNQQIPSISYCLARRNAQQMAQHKATIWKHALHENALPLHSTTFDQNTLFSHEQNHPRNKSRRLCTHVEIGAQIELHVGHNLRVSSNAFKMVPTCVLVPKNALHCSRIATTMENPLETQDWKKWQTLHAWNGSHLGSLTCARCLLTSIPGGVQHRQMQQIQSGTRNHLRPTTYRQHDGFKNNSCVGSFAPHRLPVWKMSLQWWSQIQHGLAVDNHNLHAMQRGCENHQIQKLDQQWPFHMDLGNDDTQTLTKEKQPPNDSCNDVPCGMRSPICSSKITFQFRNNKLHYFQPWVLRLQQHQKLPHTRRHDMTWWTCLKH